jgi:hypothetical protein
MSSAKALLALLAATSLAACECGDSTSLATLARSSGTVARQPKGHRWASASIGDRFVVGDAVRTGARSRADLEMARGAGLRLSERTTVRFARSRGAGSRLRFSVETGQTEVEAGDEDLWIEGELGAVRIERSSRVRLTAGRGIEVEVLTGAAMIDRQEGPDQTLQAGQHGDLAMTPTAPLSTSAQTVGSGTESTRASGAPVAGGIRVDVQAGEGAIRAAGQGTYQGLSPGVTSVAAGSILRLGASGRATVRRGADEASLTGPTEVLLGPTGSSLLRATRGVTSATATGGDVRLEVPGGTIVLRAGGTRARVAVGADSTEITPQSGSVLVDARQDVSVSAGQLAVLGSDGTVAVSVHGGGRADLSIPAGESPVIHDAGAPTAVGIRFGPRCAGLGTVEVTGSRRILPVSGSGSAVLTLRAGVWGYRLRCAATPEGPIAESATGTITVRADSGATPLAKRIAHNALDADGRNYTVLYQNLLPSLTMRWSDAPAGSGFTLHVEPQAGRGRVVRGAGASHTFASGEVAEGRYRFWFESTAGVRSPTTQLRLGFDNATPAATIRDVPGAPGGGLRVTGLVEDGWAATVDGRPLPLDGHNRFVTELTVAGDAGAAAIRLEKAGRGVHYYLRRPRQASP